MAFQSIVDLSGTAGQSNFTFAFPYISRDHIHVYLDGVETTAFTFNSDFVIHLTVALVISQTVRIRRITPSAEPLVDFVNGATLGELDLDTTTLQMLYVVQEAQDLQIIDISNSLRVPEEVPIMAAASARANNFLYFDANGDPTVQPMVGTTLAFTPLVQLFSGTGAQTVFTLSSPPGAAAALIVAHSGVVQKPNTDFTLAGSILTFTTAPAAGTNNICVQNFGVAREVNTVPVSGIVGQLPATQVDYTPAMTGGILRTQDAKNYDMWTVKDFQCVGDGTTSDQTRLATAVASAYAAGRDLYWPTGTYVSTATIPNFHDVRHRGPGIVKRGSDLFYVDPSMWYEVSNTIYMATTGVDSNDGLSSAEPKQTVLTAVNMLYTYPYGSVNWKFQFAAGTFTTVGNSFLNPFPSPYRVQFNGAAVSLGTQPTTIFQATGHGVGAQVVGLYFQNNCRVHVTNINFQNYRTNASPDATEGSYGLTVDGRSELYTENVWTDDCDSGIFVANESQARVKGGRHGFNAVNASNIQVIRHSTVTSGYGGTAADINGATGTAFIGGQFGIIGQEYAMVHADYSYFSGISTGVKLTGSRHHALASTFNTCTIGIDALLNSFMIDSGCTFTACTDNILVRSGSRIAGLAVDESTMLGPAVVDYDAVGGSTQSATPVTIFTRTFAANEFKFRGAGFELKLYGEVVGVAATKTVTITLGATTLLTATIAAATTDYEIQVKLVNVTAASSQKIFTRKLENGVLGVRVLNVAIAEDLTASKVLTVTHQVTNVADTNRIGFVELEVLH